MYGMKVVCDDSQNPPWLGDNAMVKGHIQKGAEQTENEEDL